ncbi:MAG: sugar phosphate isomerase/epimerase family protein [Candidatus Latescibacteria bacterium]|jgi:sugar phosphate isomerase/epimerase|nr:sugar phosphate isomerase/epimerase family protein [Candidatus Latescibacterota bacterium]
MRYAAMTFMFKSWLSSGKMTHEAMLEGFSRAGATGVEVFDRDFVEDPGLLKRYRDVLADLNMEVAAVDVICNLVCPDASQKRESQDTLRRGLDICKELGTQIAHVAGHRQMEGVTPEDGKKMIAEGFLDAADIAREYGLTFAIEDYVPSPDLVCSAKDCVDIMELSDRTVEFVLDTGNFIAVGERADENFDLVAPHICHTHFKDFADDPGSERGFRSCDLGQGVIPNAETARLLMDAGYSGWIALETYSRDDLNPVEAVELELPVLRSWFGE